MSAGADPGSGPSPPAPGAASRSPAWPERLASASIRHRRAIVAAALALSIVCGIQAVDLFRLRVSTSLFALMPQDHPSLKHFLDVVDRLGGWGDLAVVIDSPDRRANERFAAALQDRVNLFGWVNYAEYQTAGAFVQANALLLISAEDLGEVEARLRARYEHELSRALPGYVDLLDEGPPSIDFSDIREKYGRLGGLKPIFATEDGRRIVLLVHPRGRVGAAPAVRRQLEAVDREVRRLNPASFQPSLAVSFGGVMAERVEEYDAIVGDLAVSAGIMLLLFAALILWQFGQVSAIPLVVLTFLMPLTWTFAFGRLVVTELNVVSVFLVNILSGLGIDFAIHTMTRYQEERVAGRAIAEALARVNRNTIRACWSAGLTTAVAFWVLIPARFVGFRQVGLIAGTGLVFAFLSAWLVLPSLLAMAEAWGLFRPRPTRAFAFAPAIRRGPLVLALALAAAVAGAVAPAFLVYERDLERLRPALSAASERLRLSVRSILGAAREPIVVPVADTAEAAEVQAIVRERIRTRGGAFPVDAVLSVLDVVPPDQQSKLETIGRLRRLAGEMGEYASGEDRERLDAFGRLLVDRPVRTEDLPLNLRRRFFGLDERGGSFVFLLHHVPLLDVERADELVREVRVIQGPRKNWLAASDAIVANDLLRILREDSRWAIAASALAVLLVLWLDLRRLRRAFIVLIPLALGVGWMLAVVLAMGARLNFFNMVIFPAILGIGVDSGIHIYHRFLEAPSAPVAESLRRTAFAVVTSALTTMISFGSLVTSTHRGLASLGLIAIIGLACTLVAAVVVLPVFLDRYRRHCE